jgi:hypothetical protein
MSFYEYGDPWGDDEDPTCPVCGTAECVGDTSHIKVFGADLFPSLGHEDVYIPEDDVIQERQINPLVVARVLVARKGVPIPISKARELGLL